MGKCAGHVRERGIERKRKKRIQGGIQQQDQAEGNDELHPDSNETTDLSGDLGIPVTHSNPPY